MVCIASRDATYSVLRRNRERGLVVTCRRETAPPPRRLPSIPGRFFCERTRVALREQQVDERLVRSAGEHLGVAGKTRFPPARAPRHCPVARAAVWRRGSSSQSSSSSDASTRRARRAPCTRPSRHPLGAGSAAASELSLVGLTAVKRQPAIGRLQPDLAPRRSGPG